MYLDMYMQIFILAIFICVDESQFNNVLTVSSETLLGNSEFSMERENMSHTS